MKTGRLFILATLIFFAAAASVSAQEASPTPSPAVTTGRSVEKRAQTQAQIQEKRTEVRAKVSEVHGRRLKHNFGVYYQRLSKIIDRLQERLTVLSGQGKDTAAVEEKLTDAETMLTAANAKAETAVTAFLSEPAQDQRASALAARDVAKEARAEFMAVLQLLKQVLQDMKAL
jgi:hypothetical protein